MKTINPFPKLLFIAALFFYSTLASVAENRNTESLSGDSITEATLSGINIYTSKKDKTFYLEFSQILKNNAQLSLVDQNEKVLFTENLSVGKSYVGKPFNIGILPSGTYTIQVTAANKTYWKKVKISR